MNVDFLAGFIIGFLAHSCYCDFIEILRLRREIAALEAKTKERQ